MVHVKLLCLLCYHVVVVISYYLKLAKHFCYNDVHKYFFSNILVDAWNSLSNNVVLSPSIGIFKKRLGTVNLDRLMK